MHTRTKFKSIEKCYNSLHHDITTQEPESIDKDILRRWYVSRCDPYDTNVRLPEPPAELVCELARRFDSCSTY